MQLSPGSQVGPYQIVASLGAGGMGEVYRARDVRLGREIALKVVNAAATRTPELVRRFEQEARLAGSLNHPNLVTVYDVGEHAGVPYLVTELLEGEPLRQRLARGHVPLQTALDWGAQLAHGLAAAHARGIIHRDVKPDNVFIGADGRVKLLDFGIAKLSELVSREGRRGMLEETSGGPTQTGDVIGTPGYMSPEQVRGETLDGRTDVFSLGTVLYELLGGTKAFRGQTPVESGYAVLHNDPPPLPPEVPPAVSQVVLRCLEKQPALRFQSCEDLAFALELLRSPVTPVPTARPHPPARARRLGRVVVVVAGLAVLAAAALLVTRSPPAPPGQTEQITFRWGAVRGARFAPDGRILFSAAFESGPEEVYARPPGSLEAQSLGLRPARLASISKTGELAVLLDPRFSVHSTVKGTLARVPGVGGVPREIAEHIEYADWSPDGELAVVVGVGPGRTLEYPPGHTLFRTRGWISDPRFSRRGDRLAFIHHPIYADDMGEVVVMDLQGRTKVLVERLPRVKGLAWSPDGREVWFTTGKLERNTLEAVDLDGRRRELYRAPSNIHLEDVAADGSVLFEHQFERSEVAYMDRSGKQTLLSWTDWNNTLVSFSHDRRILFSVASPLPTPEGVQPALVVMRAVDGSPAQVLGKGTAQDLSPDGRWALVLDDERRKLSAMPTGVGSARLLPTGELQLLAARWCPDGERAVVSARTPDGQENHLFAVGPGEPPRRLSEVPLSSRQILYVSPDGRLAAALDPLMRPLLVSLEDGKEGTIPGLPTDAIPRGWARDGQLWLTRGGDRAGVPARLLRIDVASGRALEDRPLAPVEPSGWLGMAQVAMSPDGQELALMFGRSLGNLYVLRGLPGPR